MFWTAIVFWTYYLIRSAFRGAAGLLFLQSPRDQPPRGPYRDHVAARYEALQEEVSALTAERDTMRTDVEEMKLRIQYLESRFRQRMILFITCSISCLALGATLAMCYSVRTYGPALAALGPQSNPYTTSCPCDDPYEAQQDVLTGELIRLQDVKIRLQHAHGIILPITIDPFTGVTRPTRPAPISERVCQANARPPKPLDLPEALYGSVSLPP